MLNDLNLILYLYIFFTQVLDLYISQIFSKIIMQSNFLV